MTYDDVRAAIVEVLGASRFFVASGGRLRIEYHPAEQTFWEIFQGHLLDHTQTRRQSTFESWRVLFQAPGAATSRPIISVKLDSGAERLYVVRYLRVYGWEAVKAAGNVVTGQETERTVGELVGTLAVGHPLNQVRLRTRISRCVLLAVVGTSRLPITSVESPLPAFTTGQLGYLACAAGASQRPASSAPPGDAAALGEAAESWVDDPRLLLDRIAGSWKPVRSAGAIREADPRHSNTQEMRNLDLAPSLARRWQLLSQAKLLETVLRTAAADDLPGLAERMMTLLREQNGLDGDVVAMFRTVFNYAALAPYTQFVDNLVGLLELLTASDLLGPDRVIDIFGYYLRHLARHLTAFDLVTFHHRGADYPDALFLDRLLKAYIALAEAHPDRFAARESAPPSHERRCRLRRRALRQAYLLRRQYEGHAVPDAPTSPGENVRVLPPPFVRLPDEQIHQPQMRQKQLFAGEPTHQLLPAATQQILQHGMSDLEVLDELRELGAACFLDRPLGAFKQPGEMDRTPLLTYEAMSRSIAAGRLRELDRWGLVSAGLCQDLLGRLQVQLQLAGWPVCQCEGTGRPGVAALEDARSAAADFVFLRTSTQSLVELLACYDFRPLWNRFPEVVDWLFSGRSVLLVRTSQWPVQDTARPFLTAFDAGFNKRIELGAGTAGPSIRYLEADGVEYLQQGLRVLSVWSEDQREQVDEWSDADARLPACLPE